MSKLVLQQGLPWQTLDPFLFCVHHNNGNDELGPAASLMLAVEA